MAQTPFGQVVKLTDTGATRTNTPEYEEMVPKPKGDQQVGGSVFSTTPITESEMQSILAALPLVEPERDAVDQMMHFYKHGLQLADSDFSLTVSYMDPSLPPDDGVERGPRADDEEPHGVAFIGVKFSF